MGKSMTSQKEWTIGDLLSTSTAYWRGCALQAGVRLGVFTALDNKRLNLSDLTSNLQSDKRGTELLVNALSSMGLLVKEFEYYSNSVAARDLLSQKSSRYMGHIILHHHHILDGWAQLNEVVKTGSPAEVRSYGEETERESFLMGMFNLAMGIAPQLASQVDLKGRKLLLDLGGGPGTYAIHFCLDNPELEAVIYDRQTTEPFARETVKKFKLTKRINFEKGDFNVDPISGGPYDVAWLSHILHSNGPDACQALINKTVTDMKPGGLIMVHDFILDNNKIAPEFAALFSLNMLIHNSGRSYSEEEIVAMFENAGISDIHRHPFRGPNDSSILCGTVV